MSRISNFRRTQIRVTDSTLLQFSLWFFLFEVWYDNCLFSILISLYLNNQCLLNWYEYEYEYHFAIIKTISENSSHCSFECLCQRTCFFPTYFKALGNSFWVRPQSANSNIQTVSAHSGFVRKQHREFTLIVGGNILVPLPTGRP